jgi:hypothetical protein
MPLLALPILAQALTLGAADRIELRWVTLPQDNVWMVEDRAAASINLRWRHFSLGAEYSPSVLLSPLDDPQPALFQTATATASAFWGTARTQYMLMEAISYSEVNLTNEALAGAGANAAPTPDDGAAPPAPAAGGGAGSLGAGAGAGGQPAAEGGIAGAQPPLRANDDRSMYFSQRAAATVRTILTHRLTFTSLLMHEYGGGVDRETRRQFPLAHVPAAALTLEARLDPRNALESSANATVALAADDTQSVMLSETERLVHRFSLRTSGSLGAGVAYTRARKPDVEPIDSVDPIGEASLTHRVPLAHGFLDFLGGVRYAPVLDRVSLRFGPAVSVQAATSWSDERLTLALTLAGEFPTYPKREGALTSRAASASAEYELGSGFSVDGGVRAAWQGYAGTESIPPTGIVFVALEWKGKLERR